MDKSRHKSALTSTPYLSIVIPNEPVLQILAAFTAITMTLSILCLLIFFSSQPVLDDQVPATTNPGSSTSVTDGAADDFAEVAESD